MTLDAVARRMDGMRLFLIDDLGNLWHGDSNQLRANFDARFSGREFVDYAVKNLGFLAINTYGLSCQVRLRPRFAAAKALLTFRNWLQLTKIERIIITKFEDGWRCGKQDELVLLAEAEHRMNALIQRAHSSQAWRAAAAPSAGWSCAEYHTIGRTRTGVGRQPQ